MSLVSCCVVRYYGRYKRYSGRFYCHLFCKRSMFYVLYVFIYIYWCLTPFPYHMLFMSLNSNMKDAPMEQELRCLPEHHIFCSVPVVFTFVWPLYCLSFDLRLLVTHLVSSIFSWYDTISSRNICLYDGHSY